MALRLDQIIRNFETLWPLSGAEDWDRPGLALGNPSQLISKAILSVDLTLDVLEEAKELGAQLVISHHPPFLKPLNYISEDTIKGELAAFATRNSLAIYSAHTNADIVSGGVSDVLAKALGIEDSVPLVPTSDQIGHGRIGRLRNLITLEGFAEEVSRILPRTMAPIRIAGDLKEIISRIAVVGGAGDSFIAAAIANGANCLVTSDLRHHVSLDAVTGPPAKRINLIDVSHFAAESLWLSSAVRELEAMVSDVSFDVSRVNTDPWSKTILSGA